jgi:hypothetical protein
MAKKEKAFGSVKEIIKTYFPRQVDKKAIDQREGYGSEAEVLVEKLATEFGAGLRRGLRK